MYALLKSLCYVVRPAVYLYDHYVESLEISNYIDVEALAI